MGPPAHMTAVAEGMIPDVGEVAERIGLDLGWPLERDQCPTPHLAEAASSPDVQSVPVPPVPPDCMPTVRNSAGRWVVETATVGDWPGEGAVAPTERCSHWHSSHPVDLRRQSAPASGRRDSWS